MHQYYYYFIIHFLHHAEAGTPPKKGQVETEETENGNGKLKRKTEAEIGNGKAEIGKWSSTFVALMAFFAHARSVWG